MKKIVISMFVLVSMLFSVVVFAAAPVWKMVPERSSLTFVGTQNGAPVKGEFKKFTCDIQFDLNNLKESKVKVVVDMGSLATSYEDLTTTLKAPEWFDLKAFPQAVFESTEIAKTGDGQYQAKGNLTIRDKTIPTVLTFTATQPTQSNGMVTGYTEIKRNAFGVGHGEWASVDEVKDEVRVDFVVAATK